MIYAFIKDDVCVNTGVFEETPTDRFVELCGADLVIECPDGYGIGDCYVEGKWQKNITALAATIRATRDAILNEVDIIYCNAERWESYLSDEKAKWRAYKQALRDITDQEGFPLEVVWPEMPNNN